MSNKKNNDIVTGVDVGKMICDSLGLDPTKVQRLTITVEPDCVVVCTASISLTLASCVKLSNDVGRYKLVPKD